MRKAFVIVGAQHAREWIATSTSLYLAHALLVDPKQQTISDSKRSLRRLLDQFEFHIIPLPNPDGYRYTRKHDRLWYKNRQPVSTGKGKAACKGVDMNRNWVRATLCICPHPDPTFIRDTNGFQQRIPVLTHAVTGSQDPVHLKHMKSTPWRLILHIELVTQVRLRPS